ncbi:MAG TPA: ATP-dependent Clp protease proteolytic subunit, partial [Tepidisphaeraceae bacterium]|nr:ATP-dependent Clp protease proteolytic subunit [Tepidisphaeraceae bacterium]
MRYFLAAQVLIGTTCICVADTLITTDGRKFEGTLVRQDESAVVFDVSRGGAETRITLDPREVLKVTKGPVVQPAAPGATLTAKPATKPAAVSAVAAADAPPTPPPIEKYSGPTYYMIPLRGEVGATFTAGVLEQALADASQRSPTVVVLEIDSPGGSIAEVSRMLEVINQYKKKMRIVVFARRAISAAAITALAADDIYMRRTAIIGAATAYKLNEANGMPENISEKMESVWRATARSSAEIGKHPTAIADAMIDRNVQLYKAKEDGKTVISTNDSKGTLLKGNGKLLTMTAQEAVDCTLAAGIADDVQELGTALGYRSWTECKGVGTALAQYAEQKVERTKKQFVAIFEKFEEEIRIARVNDPTTFKDYRADRNGELT